jgi:hypothetical protein
MLYIFNTLSHIFNTCLCIHICGLYTVMGKNTSKSYPSWLFKVPTKTQLNANSPQSHNLNPTLTKTRIFHRVDHRVGAKLHFS